MCAIPQTKWVTVYWARILKMAGAKGSLCLQGSQSPLGWKSLKPVRKSEKNLLQLRQNVLKLTRVWLIVFQRREGDKGGEGERPALVWEKLVKCFKCPAKFEFSLRGNIEPTEAFFTWEGSLLTKYPFPTPGLLESQVMCMPCLRQLSCCLSSMWLEMKDLDTVGQQDRGSLRVCAGSCLSSPSLCHETETDPCVRDIVTGGTVCYCSLACSILTKTEGTLKATLTQRSIYFLLNHLWQCHHDPNLKTWNPRAEKWKESPGVNAAGRWQKQTWLCLISKLFHFTGFLKVWPARPWQNARSFLVLSGWKG